jgi:hypothetical protein
MSLAKSGLELEIWNMECDHRNVVDRLSKSHFNVSLKCSWSNARIFSLEV